MKRSRYILMTAALLMGACKQDAIVPAPASGGTPNTEVSPGNVTWTKVTAIGNSFMAGVQGGALFTDGQSNSMAKIIATQMVGAGAPETFNQPSINATLGWNLFITQPFLSDNSKPILGRMLLQYNGATSPKPTPQPYAVNDLEALPNKDVNPNFLYPAVDVPALNNFAVPAVYIGQAMTPAAGNWAVPNPAVGFTPFYARFASNPGTSSMMSDAKAANGTMIIFWLGFDDFLLYAANGGDPTKAPMTSSATFNGQFQAALLSPSTHTGILTANSQSKIVVGNFPDIFTMPHFTAVKYNAIPLDEATAATVTSQLANNYNAFVQALADNPGNAFGPTPPISQDEAARRKLTYVAGQNAILISDETLTDLTPYMAGPYAGLLPYARARQTTISDVLPLGAGSLLGTDNGSGGVYGVSAPLADAYCLIPSEISAIKANRLAYNTTISTVYLANNLRIALADVAKEYDALVAAGVKSYGNISVSPKIDPPAGIFSEDGLHVNSRGAAWLANIFIDAVNYQFRSSVPKADLSKYPATGLPIP